MSRKMKKPWRSVISVLLLLAMLMSGCIPSGFFDRDMMPFSSSEKLPAETITETDKTDIKEDSETLTQKEYSSDFDEFALEVFVFFMKDNALELNAWVKDPSVYGIEETKTLWPDYSPQGIEEKYEQMQGIYDHLILFDVKNLSEEQRITYEYLLFFLEGEMAIRDYYLLYDPLSFYSGQHVSIGYYLTTFVIRDHDDIELFFEMIEGLDEYAEGIAAFQYARSEAGFFMNEIYAQRVIDDCEYFIDNIDNDFIIPFDERIDSFDWLTDQEKDEYKERNREYVDNHVRAAYKTFIRIVSELKSTGMRGRGLSRFEGGQEYYTREVQKMTGTRQTIDEIFRTLEEYLHLWEAHYTYLDRHQSFEENEDVYLPYRTIGCVIENNLEQMEGRFPTLENIPEEYYVTYDVPPGFEGSIAGIYLYAPVDDPWSNVIYISRRATDGFDFYEVVSHEAIPGHLYQTVYFITSEPANMELRYWLSAVNESLATLEGWTTYTEGVSHEMAGLGQTEIEYAAANLALFLVSRSLIDICIHYYGWSRQDVVNYFRDSIVMDLFAFENRMFDQIDVSPASYIAYVWGYIEVTEMLQKSQDTLGDDYSEYDFHKFYLDVGMCTMDTMKKEFDRWLEEQVLIVQNAA